MTSSPKSSIPRATFTKGERLCGQIRLKEVVTTGKAVHENPIKLVGKQMELPSQEPAQVAFAVPRRYMKRAVQRNRMRRLMREAWRTGKMPYQEKLRAKQIQCAWLFIYQGRTPITLSETRSKILRSLDRWMKEHG